MVATWFGMVYGSRFTVYDTNLISFIIVSH